MTLSCVVKPICDTLPEDFEFPSSVERRDFNGFEKLFEENPLILKGIETIRKRPGTELFYGTTANRIVLFNLNENNLENVFTYGTEDEDFLLGLDFNEQGDFLYFAVVSSNYFSSGIYRIQLKDSNLNASRILFDPFPNSLLIRGNTLYYSSSTNSGICIDPKRTLSLDFLRGKRAGRLISVNLHFPLLRRTLIKDLFVTNGVSITPDERKILVVEMFEKRIWAWDINEREASIWLPNSPGIVDNLYTRENRVFAAVLQPQISPLLRFLYENVPVARIAFSLPSIPIPTVPFAGIIEFDGNGKPLVYTVDEDGNDISSITNVIVIEDEGKSKLLLSGIDIPFLGLLPLS